MVMTINSHSFSSLCETLTHIFRTHSKLVHTEKWQGRDVSNKPDAATRELLNVTVAVSLKGKPSNLNFWQSDIGPHLPWADDHFAERVGGEPLNPGETYKTWRHGASASTFLEGEAKQFNHTYMERFWPKHAGMTNGGYLADSAIVKHERPIHGIRHEYGDLRDLVTLLVSEPHTRQAYLPIFFPEDTGVGDGGRKPCTLGYQFIVRDGELHCYYPMRSCDFANHFRDDCYLAVRLMMWVIEQCRTSTKWVSPWDNVRLGSLTMHMTSLHLFINDFNQMCR